MAFVREFDNIEAIAADRVALDCEARDFELRPPRKLDRLHLSLDLACNLHLVIQTSFFAQSCEQRCVLDDHGNLASKHS